MACDQALKFIEGATLSCEKVVVVTLNSCLKQFRCNSPPLINAGQMVMMLQMYKTTNNITNISCSEGAWYDEENLAINTRDALRSYPKAPLHTRNPMALEISLFNRSFTFARCVAHNYNQSQFCQCNETTFRTVFFLPPPKPVFYFRPIDIHGTSYTAAQPLVTASPPPAGGTDGATWNLDPPWCSG